ncbi:MAG: polymer-forming cytoskeletal protein [Clostridiales bacterium]|nr:polymer-forming cytoskeletal protein [Clostridiales bacterium]
MIFKRKDVGTLIGRGTVIEGDVKSDTSVRVDGQVKGSIIAAGDVIVGKGASVSGDVTALNLYISGVVEGNVKCSGFLRIMNEGMLKGDAKACGFSADQGAFFDGKISMSYEGNPEGGVVINQAE